MKLESRCNVSGVPRVSVTLFSCGGLWMYGRLSRFYYYYYDICFLLLSADGGLGRPLHSVEVPTVIKKSVIFTTIILKHTDNKH